MTKRTETDFRDRVVREIPAPTVNVRHDQDGRQMIEHPACNATLARIRAARRDPRNWPPTA